MFFFTLISTCGFSIQNRFANLSTIAFSHYALQLPMYIFCLRIKGYLFEVDITNNFLYFSDKVSHLY